MLKPDDTRNSYDQVAAEYTARMLHELDHKPTDRALLDRFAAMVRGKGRACDIGAGPGQVAAYLHAQGVDVIGLDLSPGMVAQASAAHPGIEFRAGDMRSLDFPDDSLAGIAAFYSIIHIAPDDVTVVLREWRRALLAGGVVLLSFHEGAEVRHFDEFFGQPVNLDFVFFTREQVEGYLQEAGFALIDVVERDGDPAHEVATHRVYIFAGTPAL